MCNCCNIIRQTTDASGVSNGKQKEFLNKIHGHRTPEQCKGPLCTAAGTACPSTQTLRLNCDAIVTKYTCQGCNKEWYVCNCCKLRKSRLREMKNIVCNEEHRRLSRSDVVDSQKNDAAVNGDNDAAVNGGPGNVGGTVAELLQLIPSDKHAYFLSCINNSCAFSHQGGHGLTDGQVLCSKEGTHYKMECIGCNQSWFVDPSSRVRRSQKRDMSRFVLPATLTGEGEAESSHVAPAAQSFYENDILATNVDETDNVGGAEDLIDFGADHTADHLAASEIDVDDGGEIHRYLTDKSTFGTDVSAYYKAEWEQTGAGKKHLVGEALNVDDFSKTAGLPTLTESEVDYQTLTTAFFASLSRGQQKMGSDWLRATLTRAKNTRGQALNPAKEHKGVRQKYTEGGKSIFRNLPVPKVGHKGPDGFACVPLDQFVNHLMSKGYALKTLRWNNESDWKNEKGEFHSLKLKEIYEKVSKLEDRDELHVHLLNVWSDAFQKNALIQTGKTDLQLFTVSLEAPREERNVQRYTVPLAFGKKQKEHQYQLSCVLKDVKRLEEPVKRWCLSTKTMIPSAFYNMGIQNDYVERVNNTQTLPKGTYSRIWGYSQEPHANVPSCPKCFKRRLDTVLNSGEASQENSIEDCPDSWERKHRR